MIAIRQKEMEPVAKPVIPADIVKITLITGLIDIVKNRVMCMDKKHKATVWKLERISRAILAHFEIYPNGISP